MKKLLIIILGLSGLTAFSQKKSVDERVTELLSKMTLEE